MESLSGKMGREIDYVLNELKGNSDIANDSDKGDEIGKINQFIQLIIMLTIDPLRSIKYESLFENFRSILGGQSIFLLQFNKVIGRFVPEIIVGERIDVVKSCVHVDRDSIVGEIAKSRAPRIISKIEENYDDVILVGLCRTINASTCMFVPFKSTSARDSVMCILGSPGIEDFSEFDLKLLRAFTRIIEILRGYEDSQRSLKRQGRELEQRDFDLYTVYQVSKTLSSILDVEELTMLIADMLAEIMTVEHAMVFLMDEEETNLSIRAYKYLDPGKTCPFIEFSASEEMTDWLVSQMAEARIIRDFSDEKFNEAFPGAESALKELEMELIIPMIHKYKLVGFLALGKKYVGRGFENRDYSFLSTIAPLAANAISNAHLYELAILDGLTRVFLGRYFQQRCKEELKRALRYKKVLSLVMWDIDYFKGVNDNFGHLTGDTVLKEMTAIFKRSYRQGIDLIGRYGGEEFVMLLPDTPRDGAIIMAERLRQKVEQFEFNEGKIRLTISGGIATFPEDGTTYSELIEKADIYLYKAKRAGRNKVCTDNPDPSTE